jgi:hypothetical protein
MRLILHIGSHKTGTTAIQRFLSSNQSALARQGFHQARLGASITANEIANVIGAGNADAGREFFHRHLELARKRGAHTMIVSAENFYAMSLVEAALANRPLDDFAGRERAAVARLKSAIPAGITDHRVVCYLRRPDRYAESLYNQRIKYENFAESFDQYLRLVEPALAYNEVASIWSEAFGNENCTFTIYELVEGDVREQFARNVLEVAEADFSFDAGDRVNERLSRDVLEFKKERNGTTPASQRALEYRIACLVDQRMDLRRHEPEHYQEFLSPQARAGLLSRLAPEMAALQSSFGLPSFPQLDAEHAGHGWTPYPGLDDERRAEIQRCYDVVSGKVGFRLERFNVRTSTALRRSRSGRVLLGVWRKGGMDRTLRHVARRAQRTPAT